MFWRPQRAPNSTMGSPEVFESSPVSYKIRGTSQISLLVEMVSNSRERDSSVGIRTVTCMSSVVSGYPVAP
jgi:hypothetical protein